MAFEGRRSAADDLHERSPIDRSPGSAADLVRRAAEPDPHAHVFPIVPICRIRVRICRELAGAPLAGPLYPSAETLASIVGRFLSPPRSSRARDRSSGPRKERTVLLLNGRRVAFIHLHKCAGTAVEVSLAPLLEPGDVLLGSTPEGEALQVVWEERFGLHKHSSAAEVRAFVGEEWWRRSFTFATVRSPYERAASLFNFVASIAEPRLGEVGFPLDSDHPTQRAWVERWTDPPARYWHFAAVRAYLLARGAAAPFSGFLREPVLRQERAFETQFSQLADADGRLLVQETVRAEDLELEWPRIRARVGAADLPLLRANETAPSFRRPFDSLTNDPNDVRELNERFADDFRAFGYPRRPVS